MQTYFLTKIDPACNMKRFYCVTIQPTLLGDYCVVRIIGRLGRSARLLPPVLCLDAATAQVAGERLVERKKRRGYVEQNKISD